jgi:hypothetical protein
MLGTVAGEIMRLFSKASRTANVATVGILLSSGLFWTGPIDAMENLKVVRGVLILEGKIEPGDFISVRNFLSEELNFKKMNGEVYLASAGGNLIEALRIGYLIRHLQLSTNAPSRIPPIIKDSESVVIHPSDLTNPSNYYRCTSACFLLYVGGVYRREAGLLGLHHPQLDRKMVEVTDKDISIAMVDVRDKLKSYFAEMNVPNKYLDLMFSLPPNKLRWITKSEFDADLKGYVPQVRVLLDAKCNSRLETDHSNEMHACIARIMTDLRMEAWRKIFHRT